MELLENHDARCPLCGSTRGTDNIKICGYHKILLLYPGLNWKDLDNLDPEYFAEGSARFERIMEEAKRMYDETLNKLAE